MQKNGSADNTNVTLISMSASDVWKSFVQATTSSVNMFKIKLISHLFHFANDRPARCSTPASSDAGRRCINVIITLDNATVTKVSAEAYGRKSVL